MGSGVAQRLSQRENFRSIVLERLKAATESEKAQLAPVGAVGPFLETLAGVLHQWRFCLCLSSARAIAPFAFADTPSANTTVSRDLR